MSLRRMMIFALVSKIKSLIQSFKTRVLSQGEFEAETCLDVQLTDLDNKGLLDSASFVLTPNGYKENLLFAVKPDKVGTNLLLRSEEFDNSYWNKTRCSIVSNQEIAPNGTLTADYVVDDNTTGLRYVGVIGVPTSIGQTYTFSIFVKKKDRSQIVIQINEGSAIFPTVKFNFDSQSFTQTTPLLTSSFQSVGNGWFRIILTRTPTTGTSSVIGILPTDVNGNYSGIGDGVSRTIIWGAQLELGSTATDYISTTDRAIINGTIGDLTVTRATTATRVNEQGLIEEVPYNLLQQSETFDNTYWTKQNTTISINSITAPNGTMTADKLKGNSGVTYSYTSALGVNIVSNSFISNTTERVVSFYLKYGGLNRIRVMYGVSTNININIYIEVDLQLGIITGSNGVYLGNTIASNFFIEDAGNGWYRLGFTVIMTISQTNNRFGIGLGDTTKTVGNGEDGVYIWGAQLVEGTQPKDYFPTTNRFNIPRLDYSNGSCPSILVEPQRTNLLAQSADFTNGWTQEGSSITGNTQTGPDGLLSADSIFELATNDVHRTYRPSITVTANAIYTTSFFVKKNNIRYVRLILTQNGSTTIWAGAQFDLDTKTFTSQVGSGGGVFSSASITPFVNGWYRISVVGSIPGTGMIPMLVLSNGSALLNSDTRGCPVYLGNTSNSLFVWGAQLEAGSSVTSYIPTTTATVTRNADVISNTNAYNLIGQTEGTILIKGAQFNRGIVFRIRNNTTISVNRMVIFGIDTGGNVEVGVMKNNVNVSTVYYLNVKKKNIIMVYSQNIFKVFINGQLIYQYNYPISTDFTAVLNTVEFGSLSENGTANFDFISLWKTQITDAQAIQLTTL